MRSNSRNSGATSCETQANASGNSSARMRRAISSCVGADEAVQEADRDRLHPGLAQPPHRRAHRRLVQRDLDAAVVAHAFRHLQAQIARHQRRRLVGLQVVQVGPLLPADLQQVAKPVRGDQPGLHAAMLDQRVGRHRRAVTEIADRRRRGVDPRQRLPPRPRRCRATGSSGVDATFHTSTRPVPSSNRQTSVNVPPESTPTRQAIRQPPMPTLSQAREIDANRGQRFWVRGNRLSLLPGLCPPRAVDQR